MYKNSQTTSKKCHYHAAAMADVTIGSSYSITIVTSVTILWKSYKKTAFALQQTHAEVPNLCTNNTRLRKRLRRMRNLQKPSKTIKLVTTLMMPEPYVKTV